LKQNQKNKMRRVETITEAIIEKVKMLLPTGSLREVATKSEVSYYTVWCISKGKYDSKEPLQQKKERSTEFFDEMQMDWI